MAQQPNYGALSDTSVEQAQIERARRYAELMQQQSMQPLDGNQMAGGWVVPVSPLAGAAKMAQAYQAKKGLENADERQKALAQKVREQGVNDSQSFMQALQGTPAMPAQPAPADELGGGPAAPEQAAVPGDRNKALAIALQSQNPMVQGAGQSILADMLKPKAPIKVGQNDSLVDPTTLKPVFTPTPQTKYYVVGGNLVAEPQAGQTTTPPPAFTAPKDQWGEPYQLNGKTVQKNSATGEIRQVVREPVNVTANAINAGPKAFETELGKLDAEKLGKFRDNAESAQQTLGIVQNLRSAIQQGTYSGGGANLKAEAANIINGITGATPKGLVGSQLFNAEASKLVLEKIKTLGANPSNADREFIEKTVPQLGTSKEARDALINYLEQRANQQLDLYKRADAHARANRGLGGFDQFAQPANPQQPAPPAQSGVTRYDSNGNRI